MRNSLLLLNLHLEVAGVKHENKWPKIDRFHWGERTLQKRAGPFHPISLNDFGVHLFSMPSSCFERSVLNRDESWESAFWIGKMVN